MPPKAVPPVTPNEQLEFTAPKGPFHATPHGLKEHIDDPTDESRAWVAQVMNSETFLCKIGDFLHDYGPTRVPPEDVAACKEALLEAELLEHREGVYSWAAYRMLPSEWDEVEGKVFEHLEPIVDAIFAYAHSISKSGNDYTFKLVPDSHLTASIAGTNHKMDACIIEDAKYKGVLTNDNIIIAKEFKKEKHWREQIDVREKIVGDCHHILDDDPRRMFIFGTTMEDTRMSVWYLSRSHSVKSISFNWATEDVDRFIEVYLSFAFATPAELGVDPLVHKAPMDPKSKDISEREQQYIYECRPEADYADAEAATAKTRYYKTIHSLTPERPYRISGRTTRVWKVIEVDSIDKANKIVGAKPVILKDVWLDVTRHTEAENMDLIFKAVDEFVADGHDHYPGPHGLGQFMVEESRFQHFDQKTKTRLQQLLTDRQYQSLFLTKRHAWKGEVTKERSEHVKRPLEPIFIPLVAAKEGAGRSGNVTRTLYSQDTSSLQPRESVTAKLAKKVTPLGLSSREFGQKQQSGFVYEEVCTSLWDLPTLGDVLDILRQALDALQVLYCAGWVHRDISNGNILAVPVTQNGSTIWKVKLSDFEFAQPHGHRIHSSDPRTGTPYFMPHEILARSYLLNDVRDIRPEENFGDQLNLPGGSDNPNYQRFMSFKRFHGKTIASLPASATPHIPPRDTVVTYNYQHDVESLWWIALYYITAGVGHIPSFKYAETIFLNDLILQIPRAKALTSEVQTTLETALRPSLQVVFPGAMNKLREELYKQYIVRALFGQLDIPESYSEVHGVFAREFDRLLEDNAGNWKQTRLVPVKNTRAQLERALKRPRDDAPTLEEIPESSKRGKINL